MVMGTDHIKMAVVILHTVIIEMVSRHLLMDEGQRGDKMNVQTPGYPQDHLHRPRISSTTVQGPIIVMVIGLVRGTLIASAPNYLGVEQAGLTSTLTFRAMDQIAADLRGRTALALTMIAQDGEMITTADMTEIEIEIGRE